MNLTVLVLSLLIGLAVAYLIFVLFLQTPKISLSRAAIAVGLAALFGGINYLACTRWLASSIGEIHLHKTGIAVCLVLPALFLPSLYRPPAYPQSPLLRSWSQVMIQLQASALNSAAAQLPRNAIRLDLGDKNIVNRHGFDPAGQWQQVGDALALAPGSTASLQWEGGVSQSVTLSIVPPAIDGTLAVYWDGVTTSIPLQKGTVEPLVLNKTFSVPWGYSLSIFLSIHVVASWVLILLMLILRSRLGRLESLQSSSTSFWLVVALIAVLSILAVKIQFDNLPFAGFLQEEQIFRHVQIMTGQADDPWQYRLLSEVMVELGVRLFQFLSAPQPYILAFTAVRILQNAAILFLAFALYRKISASRTLALLGVLILTASMGTVFYDSDLSFNTYSDLIFYLLAALLLLDRHYFATALVVLFAALNRETSGLIPFMLLGAILVQGDSLRAKGMAVVLSTGIFAAVFLGLRLLMPDRPPFIPHGQAAGFPLLIYNFTRQLTWSDLFATLGLIPFLGLAAYNSWPLLWKVFFLIICPAWFVTHFLLGVVAETRLFLVPQALIFIPGALFLVNRLLSTSQPAPAMAAV